jgi:sulfite exporter TauE/SafE
MTSLAIGLSHCEAVFTERGSLLVSLIMAGLVGGVTHCAGMCGPFVLSQVTSRLEGVPASKMREWHRLTGAALLPYHLGRTTTYAGLGAALALAAGSLGDMAGLRWLSAGLLILAALLFLGYAIPKLKMALPGGRRAESWWSAKVGRAARPLFATPTGWRGYGLGLMLGFIPCGLLYAALAAAASSGDPVAGAFGMVAFALGTLPALFTVGIAGHLAGQRWNGVVAKVAPALLLLNAGVLTYLAVTMVA